jgi:SagB-type dehydrogenase family enzyme
VDWANQPRPFKLYPRLPAIPLPFERPTSRIAALDAIASPGIERSDRQAATLETVAMILHFSAGIVRRLKLRGSGRELAFRAAACTGAAYHIDLYLVCGPLDGLPAGVYQYGPQDDALRLLRPGDQRSALIASCAGQAWVARAPSSLILTTTFWRNAWRYGERAYRHAYWDSGTIVANALALATAYGQASGVVLGFVDRALNRLLDLDPRKEVALAVLPLGHDPEADPLPAEPITPLGLRTAVYSASEIEYPAIRAVHTASSLPGPDEVRVWRHAAYPPGLPLSPHERQTHGDLERDDSRESSGLPRRQPRGSMAVEELLESDSEGRSTVEACIQRRGSVRRFSLAPIALDLLHAVLRSATQGFEADYRSETGRSLVACLLLVSAVDGLDPGLYRYAPVDEMLEILDPQVDVRALAGSLVLDEHLGAGAAVNVYFLAHLPSILGALGNRGYRAAQLEAGVLTGKLYLAAHALGLGATGLTFYDDEVGRAFGPHAPEHSAMLVVALGHRA